MQTMSTSQLERKGASDGATEIRRQESLLKTGALQDAIFNSAYFSSIATDEKGVIQIFNVGAERMLGYTAAEVTNKITPADISDPQELIARAKALSIELDTPITPGFAALVFKASRGIEDIYELTYFRKDGSRFPAVVSVTALRDVDDAIIGYLLIGTDNTARKQVEAAQALLDQRLRDQQSYTRSLIENLEDKNIELERASRMKSEFLASMSHELRTPLNAIIGFSEALKDGLMGQTSELQHEYIDDIFSSGQHLLSLINDILDLSKVEAGMMALEMEAVDLNSLLANSLTIVRENAAAKNVTLELDIGTDLGVQELDVRKTKQIVYNLLSNAVKFSASGGTVVLRARPVARGQVGSLPGHWPAHAFALADNAHELFLKICVSDHGIGISQDNMTKLFQAFSQIDSSLARKFEGTGLGLAMVKQLAELQGGTVAVASAEGEGSHFGAWLPLRQASQLALPAPTHVDAAPAGPKERFALVVDDNDQAAELARLLLEAEGFTVLRAASAEAALALAPQQALSLITLDIGLPGMDGWAFLQRLREDPALACVPAVIVAGVIDNGLALASGAAATLQKPISRAQLKTSLAALGLHAAPEHTCTVLVVDSDAKAVEVIAGLLPPPAYAVIRAYNGSEAITLAQRLQPDLIVLDLVMSGVTGFDVVAALRGDDSTAGIPILIVTAKHITAQERDSLRDRSSQPIHIVQKAGFKQSEFITSVRRALLH